MDSLTAAIQRCQLSLKLDNETEGQGNCFPNSIVQQCRRPEVREWLKQNNPPALFSGQQWIRQKVTNFALNSNLDLITRLKAKYEREIQPVERKSWMEYWTHMAQDGTWVDHMFVQMTAWFMRLNILILTTSSLPDSPFIHISGNLTQSEEPQSGPPILIGNYTNVHYQSLLNDNRHKEKDNDKKSSNKEQGIQQNDDFTYIQDRKIKCFQTFNNGKIMCPDCNNIFISIIKHLQNPSCQISQFKIDSKEFKSQYESFKEGYRLEMARKRKIKSRLKLKEEKGLEEVRKADNDNKAKSRSNLIEKMGLEKVRKVERDSKAKSRVNQQNKKGIEEVREADNDNKAKSRANLIEKKGLEKVRKVKVTAKQKVH